MSVQFLYFETASYKLDIRHNQPPPDDTMLRALLLDNKITFINGRNQLSLPEKLSLLHIKCMHRPSHPKR